MMHPSLTNLFLLPLLLLLLPLPKLGLLLQLAGGGSTSSRHVPAVLLFGLDPAVQGVEQGVMLFHGSHALPRRYFVLVAETTDADAAVHELLVVTTDSGAGCNGNFVINTSAAVGVG